MGTELGQPSADVPSFSDQINSTPPAPPAAQPVEIDNIVPPGGVTGGAEAAYARFRGAAGPAAQPELLCEGRGGTSIVGASGSRDRITCLGRLFEIRRKPE